MRRNCLRCSLFVISFAIILLVFFSSLFLLDRYPGIQQLVRSTEVFERTLANSGLLSLQKTLSKEGTSPGQNLKSRRRSLLIFGQDRSGTTFLSAMFARDPKVFMVYEPLWITRMMRYEDQINQFIDLQKLEVEVTGSILNCTFSKSIAATKFLSFVTTPWTGALPNNVFTSQHFCKGTGTDGNELSCPDLSQSPEYVDKVCDAEFTYSVVKVAPVRLPHDTIADLVPQVFTENPDVDIRILHVIRDPRGNINSRIDIKWIKDYPNPWLAQSAQQLCEKIWTNLNHASESLKTLGLAHRYKLVLYKNIADNPIKMMHDIYDFAGFEQSPAVEEWIKKTTNPGKEQLKNELKKPYSTVRNATGNAYKWRDDRFYERNRIIENECKYLMKTMGLTRVTTPERPLEKKILKEKAIRQTLHEPNM